jgi:hypothetical protein
MKHMRGAVILLLLGAIGFAAATRTRAPVLLASAASAQGAAQAAAPDTPATQQPIARKPQFVVAFLLDPGLTRGIFMGDRWVSPPSYFFAQQGLQYVVQAKAQLINTRGDHIDVPAEWSPSDPGMVAINREASGAVTIVVTRTGDSNLAVSMGNSAKTLHIHADQVADGMQVRITQ